MFHGMSMLIFWIIAFGFIFMIVGKNNDSSNETALDILKKRLAKGDISEKEYTSLKESII
jgi:uncharacterized membrane protein